MELTRRADTLFDALMFSRRLGEVDYSSDRYIEDLSKAIEIDPTYANAYRSRSCERSNTNDLAGALADAQRSVELDPFDASSWWVRSNARARLGDLDGAIGDLGQVIARVNDPPELHRHMLRRARLYVTKGDFDRAIGDFDRIIADEKRFPVFFHERGRAWHRKGDLQRASDDYTRALELDEWHLSSTFQRACVREARDADAVLAIADYRKAIQWDACGLRAWLESDSDVPPWAARGSVGDDLRSLADSLGTGLQAGGNTEQALSTVNAAIERDPSSAYAFYLRGRLRAKSHDRDGAIKDFERSLGLAKPDVRWLPRMELKILKD
ncbi:tetratricopeptide repeat protein [bacterium]|nr:tetratricopeptide repeat protein [bacterium]